MTLRTSGLLVVCLWAALPLARAAEPSPEESALALEVDVDLALRTALAHHPSIGEARARSTASQERVEASGRRPDPELTSELRNVPLAEPTALGAAEMLMLGVRQSFPAVGSLPAQRRVAESESRIASSDLRTRELDLALQVKRAFAEYARADAEWRIRQESLLLSQRLTELARAQYTANRLPQEDVLRTVSEAARQESEIASVEQQKRSAAALLNVLMGRAPDAPLGPPRAQTPAGTVESLSAKEELDQRRPEIAAAASAIERSNANLAAAKAESRWPMFMVGLDYVYDSMRMGSGYSAMFGMSLPWLNPGRRAQVRAAEAEVAAQQQALESVRLTSQYELADATARAEAAQRTLQLLDERVMPQVRRGFEAARASFATGSGSALGVVDSLRTLLLTQIDRARAAALVATSLADLERASGTPPATSVRTGN